MGAIQTRFHQVSYILRRTLLPAGRLQHRLDSMVGPYGFWDRLQQFQYNLLLQRGLQPEHKVLDIGCGPLQGGLAFIKFLQPGNYYGIDLREVAVQEAYLQVVRNGLVHKNPFLAVSASFGAAELPQLSFNYILASQLIYHLDATELEALIQQVARILHPEGMFVCDCIGYPNKVSAQSSWAGFRFHLHSTESVIMLGQQYGLQVAVTGQIKDFGYPVEIALHTNNLFEMKPNIYAQSPLSADGSATRLDKHSDLAPQGS